jgi:hypothetical protein
MYELLGKTPSSVIQDLLRKEYSEEERNSKVINPARKIKKSASEDLKTVYVDFCELMRNKKISIILLKRFMEKTLQA